MHPYISAMNGGERRRDMLAVAERRRRAGRPAMWLGLPGPRAGLRVTDRAYADCRDWVGSC
jgi:hypothetical protein